MRNPASKAANVAKELARTNYEAAATTNREAEAEHQAAHKAQQKADLALHEASVRAGAARDALVKAAFEYAKHF